MAGGIFLDQGWNLCLLHWQENSLPLSHQGSQLSIFWTQLQQNKATHLYGRKPQSIKTEDPWREPTQGNLLQATSLFESLYLSLCPLYPLIFMLCAFLLLLSYNHGLRVLVCICLCVCVWTNTPVFAVYSFSIFLYLIINILIEWLFKWGNELFYISSS